MKRNIAAAIALKHFDPASRQHFGGSKHIGCPGIASKRDDGGMFKQQKHIADLASLAQIDQLPLQPNPFAIINLTELDDRNHGGIEIIGPEWMPRTPRRCYVLPLSSRFATEQICGDTRFAKTHFEALQG